MCPNRTTFWTLRSRSISHCAITGVFAIVGVTVTSMRSTTPAASSLRKKSSGESAATAAAMVSAPIPMKMAGSGCTKARLSIQGSRGLTQQIVSGSTPLRSSQTPVSVAVLPDPTMTNWLGVGDRDQIVHRHHARPVRDSEWGPVVAGMSGEM